MAATLIATMPQHIKTFLFSVQASYYRREILYLSFEYLNVGKAVAFALLKKMLDGLLGAHSSHLNRHRSSGRGNSFSTTVCNRDTVSYLGQFQLRETFTRGITYPAYFFLHRR